MHSAAVQRTAGAPVLQALHDISVLAADGRHDPAAVAALAAEHACRLLDAEAAAVFEWDERQDLLVPVYESPSAARGVLRPRSRLPVVAWADRGIGRIAQLVERLPYKQEVTGSTPVSPTRHNRRFWSRR